MTMKLEINKNKIDNWLKVNACRIAELSLQAPANNEQFKELENVIGKPLPQDFKELYLWHNGLTDADNFGSLFFGMDFFPIEQVTNKYMALKKDIATHNSPLKIVDKEIDASGTLNIGWIQFGFDGSHTALYLDLLPAQDGKYRQIIFLDDEYEAGILVANSTTELIEDFANDLENGLYHLQADALEDGNHYLEPDGKIDIVNWQTSERWKR